jgi:hypothetical protein
MSLSSSDISDNTITTGADFSRQEAEVYSSNQFFENVVLKRQLSWQNYQNKRRSENNINNFDMTSPSIAFISELSKIFAFKIKELCHTRDLFCSREYPLSFTGEEALV